LGVMLCQLAEASLELDGLCASGPCSSCGMEEVEVEKVVAALERGVGHLWQCLGQEDVKVARVHSALGACLGRMPASAPAGLKLVLAALEVQEAGLQEGHLKRQGRVDQSTGEKPSRGSIPDHSRSDVGDEDASGPEDCESDCSFSSQTSLDEDLELELELELELRREDARGGVE